MSKHLCNLNNAITNQLHFLVQPQLAKEEGFYGQRAVNDMAHQPVWRPQRGLPKQAVTVSNWFINARVRVWKPMVEEVHTLETRQLPKTSSDVQDLRNSFPSCPPKRAKNDNKYSDHHMMEGNKEHMNFYDSFSIYSASANRGVSLTLGLHQNNATVSPWTTNGSSQRFVIGSLDGQNREIIGGQFLHEFGDGLLIKEGSSVKATGRIAQIQVNGVQRYRVILSVLRAFDNRQRKTVMSSSNAHRKQERWGKGAKQR
ncbi:hypothetical protein L1987_63832 [Smallanthus sonchifolius]|uniref:Uncharacterized protein n=1 Tax=Smallanthus sonchifolius TaxID=185202 RepID=A0ACB9CEF1_9ASTR|nr:hypothetical protein L1987_63832 [Smallanthus sonchifolius]